MSHITLTEKSHKPHTTRCTPNKHTPHSTLQLPLHTHLALETTHAHINVAIVASHTQNTHWPTDQCITWEVASTVHVSENTKCITITNLTHKHTICCVTRTHLHHHHTTLHTLNPHISEAMDIIHKHTPLTPIHQYTNHTQKPTNINTQRKPLVKQTELCRATSLGHCTTCNHTTRTDASHYATDNFGNTTRHNTTRCILIEHNSSTPQLSTHTHITVETLNASQ